MVKRKRSDSPLLVKIFLRKLDRQMRHPSSMKAVADCRGKQSALSRLRSQNRHLVRERGSSLARWYKARQRRY